MRPAEVVDTRVEAVEAAGMRPEVEVGTRAVVAVEVGIRAVEVVGIGRVQAGRLEKAHFSQKAREMGHPARWG
jgi:hypothetical protein